MRSFHTELKSGILKELVDFQNESFLIIYSLLFIQDVNFFFFSQREIEVFEEDMDLSVVISGFHIAVSKGFT